MDRAEESMKRLFNEAMDMGIPVESITGTGDPIKEINKIVRQKEIDIVFASTRRKDIERRFYTGTIAKSLFLKLPCSVALVRVVNMGRIHPGKILVPLKARINNIAERAYFAAMMARSFDAKIFMFHAAKPITKFFKGDIHLTPAQWEKRSSNDFSAFLGYLREKKIDFECRLSPGAAGRIITMEAAAKRHDLIIMGVAKRNLLSSMIKSNPVEDVLRETPCDLIILKTAS